MERDGADVGRPILVIITVFDHDIVPTGIGCSHLRRMRLIVVDHIDAIDFEGNFVFDRSLCDFNPATLEKRAALTPEMPQFDLTVRRNDTRDSCVSSLNLNGYSTGIQEIPLMIVSK